MQDSFYRNFLNEEDKIIAFIGGGGKTTLIQRISNDCQSLGKKVIILSLFPFITPLDANVFVSEDVSILKKQLKRELSKINILYIGKEYQRGTLANFSSNDIKAILKDIPCDHVFIEADSTKGRSISGYNRIPATIFQNIDRYINVLGADAFNQVNNTNWIAYQDQFWRSKRVLTPMDIAAWHKAHPLFEKLSQKSLPATFFINKVENIFIENIAIPLGKSFKLTDVDRVIIGSVYNSNLHVIK